MSADRASSAERGPGSESRRGPAVALTIAGSDSGGGAGLQADLRTFAAHRVFGTCAVTAITAQHTSAVLAVEPIDPRLVDLQITAVLDDLPVAAVKTGMLATTETVRSVARRAAAGDLPHLVVDPVLFASTGRPLLESEGPRTYVDELIPHALVVTPNLREAQALTGIGIDNVEHMIDAAKKLADLGATTVVVKGGHLGGDSAPDVVVHEGEVTLLEVARIETVNDHGTGCTLSASIAAQLALGEEPSGAVRNAKNYVTDAIRGAVDWSLGSGRGPLDQLGWSLD
ncbi:MAG TPA: bifunctional hydroxymethylpyrimidine kinase/phosphomethylpyrimidine kinase [Acidimicrobiales bacterium]|nr:bifunctional hydroxymethylpyrimidine kinase/phosphomethylpyrimidine kinase [Acidimicrobiales bacterium]